MREAIFSIIGLLFFSSCHYHETIRLSGHSYYISGGLYNRRIFSENSLLYKTSIYSDVVAYDYDENYIIVKQLPTTHYASIHIGFDLYNRYTTYASYLADTNIFNKKEWSSLKGHIESDSVNYRIFHSRGASLENDSMDIHISHSIADSLIHNDPYYKNIYSRSENYWIIINVRDSLIGPLTKEEFLIQRKQLNIPDKLDFEKEQ